jgi:hypothetical protein
VQGHWCKDGIAVMPCATETKKATLRWLWNQG